MATRFPPLAPTSDFPSPPEPLGLRTSESPLDHALTLLLAGDIDAALRWAASTLERTGSPAAVLITSRLLDQMGRTRAAIDGFRLALEQAVDGSDLPLAVAAINDLRHLGVDVRDLLDYVANAFCRGSVRLLREDVPQMLAPSTGGSEFVQPLSPFLAGPALASRATQILQEAKRRRDESIGAELPRLFPLQAFSALTREALYDLLAAFQMVTVPAGHKVIQEGAEGTATYVVARGEVEVSRRATNGDTSFTLALSRLGRGAFFGEMAMLSSLPSPSTATTTRPTILLVAKREALVQLAAKRTEIAAQLAAHCRRNSLANLGWTSPVVAAVPPLERSRMVERLEMRIFERGDALTIAGEDTTGMYVVVSGEVAIVAKEWDERVLLATLGAGETVGEMELVLCRQAYADAIATRPTATLFLSRDEFAALVQDNPAVLHGLYSVAVQRHAETNFALQAGSASVAEEDLLEPTEVQQSPPAMPFEPPLPGARTLIGGITPAPRPPTPSQAQPRETPSRRASLIPPPPPMRVPPPPMRQPPPPTTAGSSIRPTSNTLPGTPKSQILERPPSMWVLPAAVTGSFAAAAAAIVTIGILHGQQLMPGASTAAAAGAPPAQATSIVTAPAVSPPAGSAGSDAPTGNAEPTSAIASSKSADVKIKPASRATTPHTPSPHVHAPVVTPGPAVTASAVAAAHVPASAEPSTPASLARAPSPTSDEFGGRQ